MLRRAVLTSGLLVALCASCKAPSSESLYEPFDPSMMPASSGGSGGASSAPPSSVLPTPANDTSTSEGQGGALGLAGAGGGGTDSPVTNVVVDAGSPDAGDATAPIDAAPPCASNVEVCDGLDNDCDGEIDEGNTCAATCAGFALQGHGYMFCSDSVVRDIAADRCQAQGMRLVWIETANENAFLVARIAAADVPAATDPEILTYIGGTDSGDEGNWYWRGRGAIPDGFQFWQGAAAANGGRPVGGAFSNWTTTEPNNTDDDENCTVLSVIGDNNRQPGNWDDRDCDSAHPFVCEVP